jgi:hypothetical protein|tara:strand:+ start:365 stop:1087 length:723 start_codon:yes stop_codon:yes gene_type:complete
MKRTAILGALFVSAVAFGMAPHSETSCCGPTCMMPVFMNCLQPDQEREPERQSDTTGIRRPKLSPRGMSKDGDYQFARERKMPPNMVEHVMAVATEIDPDLAEQLSTMCENDPEAFQQIIRKQGRRLGSLIRLREDDPELFEVKVTELKTDAEIYHKAESLRDAELGSPESQAKIAELRGLIRVKTALTVRAQSLYISRLEKHLAALRTKLEDTTARFDEIVDTRVNELIGTVQNVKQKD